MSEIKICIPLYKICYSVTFIILLAFVRGISYDFEIGIAIDVAIPVLAIIFCAETYELEFHERRWEIFSLQPLKKRALTIKKRLFIEIVYLYLLAMAGYWMFYWQKPNTGKLLSGITSYVMFLEAVFVTIAFFGIFSMMAVNVIKHLWAGIGISVMLWLFLFSTVGKEMFGDFNIFSFSFRESEELGQWDWLVGKGIALLITVVLFVTIPYSMKKIRFIQR